MKQGIGFKACCIVQDPRTGALSFVSLHNMAYTYRLHRFIMPMPGWGPITLWRHGADAYAAVQDLGEDNFVVLECAYIEAADSELVEFMDGGYWSHSNVEHDERTVCAELVYPLRILSFEQGPRIREYSFYTVGNVSHASLHDALRWTYDYCLSEPPRWGSEHYCRQDQMFLLPGYGIVLTNSEEEWQKERYKGFDLWRAGVEGERLIPWRQHLESERPTSNSIVVG